MKREIKFRAFCRDKMNYQKESGIYDMEKLFGNVRGDAELMQYTGLKDKNGKEIYEGDIVKITEDDEDSVMGNEFVFVGVVKFGGNEKYVSDYKGSFILHVKEWYKEEGLLFNLRYRYEVIGNVHEYPQHLS